MLIAIILAILITALEAAIAAWHWPATPVPPEHVVATTIVLERAPPTPRPTPAPTPTPVPTTIPTPLVHVTVAPVQRAAPPQQHHAGGASAVVQPVRHPMVHHTRTAPRAVAALGDGAGSGSGVGDDAGSGAGNGTGGSGTGLVDAQPCGEVDFLPNEAPRIVGDVSYETIRATVRYPDGHRASDVFPYPWVYADWMDTDPWSPLNVRKANEVAFAQLPPPGENPQRYSDVIRYILDHTTSAGHTILQPCPR